VSEDPAAPHAPLAPDATHVTPTPIEPVPRPRIWTLALACLALLVGVIAFAGVSWLVAIALTPGPAANAPTAALDRLLAALETLPGLVVTAAVSAIGIGGVALLAASMSPVPFVERLQLRRPHLALVGWVLAVVGGLAVSEGSDALLQWTGVGRGETLEQMGDVLRGAHGVLLALAVLTIGLCAGTAEELFFRGYLQSRLVQRFGPLAGIALASGMFALAHLELRHSFFALVFGGFVGWIAWRTGSVWPSVAVHVVNNALSTLMTAKLGTDAPEGPNEPRTLFLVSFAVLAASVLGLRRIFRGRTAS
jgi:membrane protease YdiL (CAAX protease family)